jgi:hypothetical protein
VYPKMDRKRGSVSPCGNALLRANRDDIRHQY